MTSVNPNVNISKHGWTEFIPIWTYLDSHIIDYRSVLFINVFNLTIKSFQITLSLKSYKWFMGTSRKPQFISDFYFLQLSLNSVHDSGQRNFKISYNYIYSNEALLSLRCCTDNSVIYVSKWHVLQLSQRLCNNNYSRDISTIPQLQIKLIFFYHRVLLYEGLQHGFYRSV